MATLKQLSFSFTVTDVNVVHIIIETTMMQQAELNGVYSSEWQEYLQVLFTHFI